jgi:hypothetical protein
MYKHQHTFKFETPVCNDRLAADAGSQESARSSRAISWRCMALFGGFNFPRRRETSVQSSFSLSSYPGSFNTVLPGDFFTTSGTSSSRSADHSYCAHYTITIICSTHLATHFTNSRKKKKVRLLLNSLKRGVKLYLLLWHSVTTFYVQRVFVDFIWFSE